MGGNSVYYTMTYIGTNYFTFAWTDNPWINTWLVENGRIGINNVYPDESIQPVNTVYVFEFGY